MNQNNGPIGAVVFFGFTSRNNAAVALVVDPIALVKSRFTAQGPPKELVLAAVMGENDDAHAAFRISCDIRAPGEKDMQLTEDQRAYWRRTLALTATLLTIWFLASFVPVWFAKSLSEIRLFGWPLSFYMVAQGSLVIFVTIIWIYQRRMRELDERYGVQQEIGR